MCWNQKLADWESLLPLLTWSFVTGRNEGVAKVIILHLFVILFTGGVSASVHAGIPPRVDTPQRRSPRADNPPEHTPQSRHPPEQTPLEQTPLQSRHPESRYPLPPDTLQSRHPPEQTAPPGADTPREARLRHTVNERPVRILLKCILVIIMLEKISW